MKNNRLLLCILCLSAILHIVFLVYNPGLSFNHPQIYDPSLVKKYGDSVIKYGSYDAVNYGKAAEQLVNKGLLGFSSDKPNAYVTPGQPIYLASIIIFSNIIGADYTFVAKLVNMVLSISTVCVLYMIGYRLFNNKWIGLIAALGYALYFPPLHYFRQLLTETPSMFLFYLSILLVIVAIQTNRPAYHIWFGVIFAVCLMFRPNPTPLVIIPIIAVLMRYGIKNSMRIGLLWAIGPLLFICPWVIRNALVLHQFVLFSTQSNPLFAGSNPFFLENYTDLYNSMKSSGLSESEFAKQRIREGFKRDPVLWTSWYTIGKTMVLFRRPSAWYDYAKRYESFETLIYTYHYIIITLGSLAFFLFRKQKEVLCIGMGILIYIAFSNVFLPDDRYGFFIMPLFVLLSAYFIVRCIEMVRKPAPN